MCDGDVDGSVARADVPLWAVAAPTTIGSRMNNVEPKSAVLAADHLFTYNYIWNSYII